MNSQSYNLLTTVLGAVIPGIFGLINTIIVIRAKRRDKLVAASAQGEISKPTAPIHQKRRPRLIFIAILIGVCGIVGYYIGNMTKESPTIVKLYNPEEQINISRDRIGEIDQQILEIKQETTHIIEQPTMSEPEKEEIIRSHNEKIEQLSMEKAEYEEIAGRENDEMELKLKREFDF